MIEPPRSLPRGDSFNEVFSSGSKDGKINGKRPGRIGHCIYHVDIGFGKLLDLRIKIHIGINVAFFNKVTNGFEPGYLAQLRPGIQHKKHCVKCTMPVTSKHRIKILVKFMDSIAA